MIVIHLSLASFLFSLVDLVINLAWSATEIIECANPTGHQAIGRGILFGGCLLFLYYLVLLLSFVKFPF